MCGISCTITCNTDGVRGNSAEPVISKRDKASGGIDELLQHRGPDLSSKKILANSSQVGSIELSAHVLWTQGEDLSPQPFSNARESKFLLFNGDIYSFGTRTNAEFSESRVKNENDGSLLFNSFSECDPAVTDESLEKFKAVVGNLRGPFAFIYVDYDKRVILFGRDFFGRESLLFSISSDGSRRTVSSVATHSDGDVFEIPAAGIYCWDLRKKTIKLHPYECHDRKDILNNLGKFGVFLGKIDISFSVSVSSQIKLNFFTLINKSTFRTEKLEKLIQCAEIYRNSVPELLEEASIILAEEITEFLYLLKKSVNIRVKCQPNYCKNCILTKSTNCICSKVAILFSGGLDSMVLAYLALECLLPGESIDLVNVAFSKSENFENIPDRETGLDSYRVLKSIFEPRGKTVNFVCINVRKEEVEMMRAKVIRDLILPLTSVLDDSLGCCLWFAGRCSGILLEKNTSYTSPARVAILGSGADELLGGYGRHRNAYKNHGWPGLSSEMQEDIDRISIRNMGRDNRIVSDHGICPRMPFLDEDVVSFVTGQCDIWMKCCPLEGMDQRGLGEKLLLRASAVKLLGKEHIKLALFPKRAMQFGSRIAKLENSKEKGSDQCSRLLI